MDLFLKAILLIDIIATPLQVPTLRTVAITFMGSNLSSNCISPSSPWGAIFRSPYFLDYEKGELAMVNFGHSLTVWRIFQKRRG